VITSLLIANRGEIACRIIRTARRLGVRTVAVYSDADATALHVRQADEAVHIGAAPVRESYLLGERIIAAALATGAEAIHPGYGFLSENADFAQAVLDAGLIWVGPNPASIRAMGLKDAAKALMAAAGVPVTPGYQGADQSPEHLAREALAIGYPVLIKAVAGGGGKGMRKVAASADFADALASCQREAASSFGNDVVLIEKYIERPRHIEVQVFGDAHGNVVHLFERDCSLQRRHQKVIEEAPAPGMDDATRADLCAAAVRAAKAVDYVGAGTIEFIADTSEGLRADRIWFMEMNTRLQVEHPVTEAITGVDLVEWQLRVGSGEPLPLAQDELTITGHAIEARLYAEDPAKNFLPSVGRVTRFEVADDRARVDAAIASGDAVSPYYDPMIAKLIVHGDDRAQALAAISEALRSVTILPLTTNLGFLVRCVEDADFAAGDVDTGLIERRGEALTARPPIGAVIGRAAHDLLDTGVPGPWHAPALRGFRLGTAPRRTIMLVDQHGTRFDHELASTALSDSSASGASDTAIIGEGGEFHILRAPRTAGGAAGAGDGAIVSPMPGRITALDATEGAAVEKGERLLTLEAMKMEHTLTAPFAGTVSGLTVAVGAQVREGALLLTVVPRGE
jgi:3-methylcrotonyl-CoA carboxylase alpha subunit